MSSGDDIGLLRIILRQVIINLCSPLFFARFFPLEKLKDKFNKMHLLLHAAPILIIVALLKFTGEVLMIQDFYSLK